MSTIVRRNVAELPEASRQSIELLIGAPLKADQRLYIIVEAPVARRPVAKRLDAIKHRAWH